MQAGDRVYAQFRYYKLWPSKIKRAIHVKDGNYNYEVHCYGTVKLRSWNQEIWPHKHKHADALKDRRKNVQKAEKLDAGDTDRFPDLSASVSSMQSELIAWKVGLRMKSRNG